MDDTTKCLLHQEIYRNVDMFMKIYQDKGLQELDSFAYNLILNLIGRSLDFSITVRKFKPEMEKVCIDEYLDTIKKNLHIHLKERDKEKKEFFSKILED
jgi:hypothetical protein